MPDTPTPTLTLDVLPTEFGPPALTVIRMRDGRFAATKRFPVDLMKSEVVIDNERCRVRLEFPSQFVNFTTIEAVIAQNEASGAVQEGGSFSTSTTGPEPVTAGPWRDAETSGHMVGQAVNVIVAMANGAVPSAEIQRALTYFAGGVYSPDFLPFPRTPLTLPVDGDATDRNADLPEGREVKASVGFIRERFAQQPAKTASESFTRMERMEHLVLEIIRQRHGTLEGDRGTASRIAREISEELLTYGLPLPEVIEAADFVGNVLPDAKPAFAVTCTWPDGSETVEYLSRRAGAILCPEAEIFSASEDQEAS